MPSALDSLPKPVLAKLDELAAQHAQMERDLADPAIVVNHHKVRELSIRKAALEEFATDYKRFKSLAADAAEYRRAMGPGGDRDIAAMAQEELPRVEAEASTIIERLKAGLVQSDDNKIGSVNSRGSRGDGRGRGGAVGARPARHAAEVCHQARVAERDAGVHGGGCRGGFAERER